MRGVSRIVSDREGDDNMDLSDLARDAGASLPRKSVTERESPIGRRSSECSPRKLYILRMYSDTLLMIGDTLSA